MEQATKIFEKHWVKATGKPLDEATKHHMKYAIEAINEALGLSLDNRSLKDKLFNLANDFATEKQGDVAVKLHGIHNGIK